MMRNWPVCRPPCWSLSRASWAFGKPLQELYSGLGVEICPTSEVPEGKAEGRKRRVSGEVPQSLGQSANWGLTLGKGQSLQSIVLVYKHSFSNYHMPSPVKSRGETLVNEKQELIVQISHWNQTFAPPPGSPSPSQRMSLHQPACVTWEWHLLAFLFFEDTIPKLPKSLFCTLIPWVL